ncbi:Uncharacterised protein [Legionella pneumophila]|nr:Uncharacterised protein [Legionella pneumophila]
MTSLFSEPRKRLPAKKCKEFNWANLMAQFKKVNLIKMLKKIKELLALGLSVRKIATYFGHSNHISLNNYLGKKKIAGNN